MRVFAFLNIDTPWIAWLVYRGEMVSPRATGEQVLSVWHAKYLIDAVRDRMRQTYYSRELEIEVMRRGSFPWKVSRLSGLYFFEDLETAKKAGRRWDSSFRNEYLAEIEIRGSPQISKYDSEWVSRYMSSPDDAWIQEYLMGKPCSDEPIWELLIDGRGLVLGADVRQRAYETVKRSWPQSLGLLELSRVAVELGSDLGMIAPVITQKGRSAELKLYLNFSDAKNENFLNRLKAYDGPKNVTDLNQSSDLVCPDLSDQFVQFQM